VLIDVDIGGIKMPQAQGFQYFSSLPVFQFTGGTFY
jgi:hypothetical protein